MCVVQEAGFSVIPALFADGAVINHKMPNQRQRHGGGMKPNL
ncbi:hypothetical protein RUE5091_04286 [Ruegeria denitrificans]|uniref:Uncharacterized protein n=1 Tax=Ruegeria denitrificans TaxID=1715692 RepID=A0A0P1IKB4_9RHOB|nr:hypothetical protein RUE5091_04286 [Ruegeria denitrificans]